MRHIPDVAFVESKIKRLEQELDLEHPAKRLLEATLFIDKKFLFAAVLMGEPACPERLFGDEEWASYLEARLLARHHHAQPLTLDFILELAKCFLGQPKAEKSAIIRGYDGGKGGVFIDGQFMPVSYSDDQLATLLQNPWLDFEPTPEAEGPNVGFIRYPDLTQEQIEKELMGLSTWYNDEHSKKRLDPFSLAARLQRQLISIHPVSYVNGRLTRLLMNWSLENDGECPSALDDFDADLLSPEHDWIELVRQGSERFKKRKQQRAYATTDSLLLLGIEQEHRLYKSMKTNVPPVLVQGAQHNHFLYEAFMDSLRVRLTQGA